MGTLASELGWHVERHAARPRVYADANIPAGTIAFMRERLRWDVVAVIEDETLRRASDIDHYETARRLRRTLVTLDDDFLDPARFPPAGSPGVIVLSAPNEIGLARLLRKIARAFFPSPGPVPAPPAGLPLAGRTIQVGPDWEPPHARVPRARRRRGRSA